MMETSTAILMSLAIPVLACISNLLHGDERPNLRDGVTLIAAIATFGCVFSILINNGGALTEVYTVFSVMPGLDIAFHVEPLGLLFRTDCLGFVGGCPSLCNRLHAR